VGFPSSQDRQTNIQHEATKTLRKPISPPRRQDRQEQRKTRNLNKPENSYWVVVLLGELCVFAVKIAFG
jgi:hypothetical protein